MTDDAASEHAAPDRPDRRALLGVGAIGAALAVFRGQVASAETSEQESELIQFAIRVELAARDLYDSAVAAGATGQVWEIMREHHESYAHRLAGIVAVSADERDDAVFDALESSFRGATAAAASELENVAAATHTELLSLVGEDDAASAIASIAAMESRHATLLATVAGNDDLDALFANPATALSPEA